MLKIQHFFFELKWKKATFKQNNPLLLNSSTYKNKLLGFTGKVGDLAQNHIKVVDEECSVLKATKLLINPLVNYIIIKRENIAIGILSKQDIVARKIDKRKDQYVSISSVMTSLPVSVQKEEPVFETLIYMMQNNVQEVLVLDGNEPYSVLTQQDWLSVQVNYPTLLIRNIQRAKTIDRLKELRKESKKIFWENFEKEGNAVSLTNIITVINDENCKRIIQLGLEQMQMRGKGVPPVPFVWIGMGSEGRKAQTIRTDQDNGIIFSDIEPEHYNTVKSWFLEFAEYVNTGLEKCGFALCDGNIMAINPMLCDSIMGWKNQFERIIFNADVKELLEASIYFDFRSVYGNVDLVDQLWVHLYEKMAKRKLFEKFFAENILQASRPPIKKWQWKFSNYSFIQLPTFDIKREGTAPLDAAIRLLALHFEVKETSTLNRLKIILQKGGISKTLADKVHIAFDYILRLRFRLEFSMKTEVETLDHTVDPNELSLIQRKELKDTLATVYELQNFVYEYITGKKVPWAYK